MASEQHAGELPADPGAGTAAGRSGRHHRPSALRTAVHERLEEMRFRHGVLLMVTTGVLLVALAAGVVWALSGGSDARPPRAGVPPLAESAPASASASARHSPHRSASSRRPRTSSSTMVGTTSPRPTPHPATPTPNGLPSWWPTDPHHPHRYHGTPPPWWHHR